MLEQLARHDDVEDRVGQSERLVEVGPVRLDPEPGRLGEGLAVGVDAHDLVPVQVRLGQRAVAAAEVEHAPARPADIPPEQRLALRPGEDEAGSALAAVGPRLLSLAVLVTIDLVGLICGLYVALIFRELYLGQWPPLWGILWKT